MTNLAKKSIEITLDLASGSRNLLFVPKEGVISKVIEPGDTCFMMHAIAMPEKETFSKKCKVDARLL